MLHRHIGTSYDRVKPQMTKALLWHRLPVPNRATASDTRFWKSKFTLHRHCIQAQNRLTASLGDAVVGSSSSTTSALRLRHGDYDSSQRRNIMASDLRHSHALAIAPNEVLLASACVFGWFWAIL